MPVVMNFLEPYLLAMRDKAPKMFGELRRHGRLDQHLKMKSAEAHAMLEDLLKRHPHPSVAQRREAEEVVMSTLIDFPAEQRKSQADEREPPEDLGIPRSGEGSPTRRDSATSISTSRARTTS